MWKRPTSLSLSASSCLSSLNLSGFWEDRESISVCLILNLLRYTSPFQLSSCLCRVRLCGLWCSVTAGNSEQGCGRPTPVQLPVSLWAWRIPSSFLGTARRGLPGLRIPGRSSCPQMCKLLGYTIICGLAEDQGQVCPTWYCFRQMLSTAQDSRIAPCKGHSACSTLRPYQLVVLGLPFFHFLSSTPSPSSCLLTLSLAGTQTPFPFF